MMQRNCSRFAAERTSCDVDSLKNEEDWARLGWAISHQVLQQLTYQQPAAVPPRERVVIWITVKILWDPEEYPSSSNRGPGIFPTVGNQP